MADKKQAAKPPAIILQLAVCVGISLLATAGYQRYKEKGRSGSAVSSAEFPMPTGTCSGLKNSFFEPEKEITKIKIPLAKECWIGWVNTPPDWKKWEFQWTEPGGIWIQFLNDKPIWLPPGSDIPFGEKRGIFRAAGNGNIFISLTRN